MQSGEAGTPHAGRDSVPRRLLQLNTRDTQLTPPPHYPVRTPPDWPMRPVSDPRLDAARTAHDADPLGRDRAHLADYSFRFDSAAVCEPDTEPTEAPARTWTLNETLVEIRRRGAGLRLGSTGPRLVHAHRLPELARAVKRHAGPLTTWVRLGLDREDGVPAARASGLRAVPFGATDWDDATRLRAAWFVRLFEAPGERIALRPGIAITDLTVFRASVAGRLAAGPASAGADGLRADLADLYAQFGAAAERLVVPEVQRARAA